MLSLLVTAIVAVGIAEGTRLWAGRGATRTDKVPVPANLERLWKQYPDPHNILIGAFGATAVHVIGTGFGVAAAIVAFLILAIVGLGYALVYEQLKHKDDPRTGIEFDNLRDPLVGAVLVFVLSLVAGPGVFAWLGNAMALAALWYAYPVLLLCNRNQYTRQI